MADILGLDRSYVGEIEQGKRNPCLLNLEVIANGLKISLPQLFSRMTEKTPTLPKESRG